MKEAPPHTRNDIGRQRAIRLPARKPTTASGTATVYTATVYMDSLGRAPPLGYGDSRIVPILVGGLLTSTRGHVRLATIFAMVRSLP
jgi:hypothetical protein